MMFRRIRFPFLLSAVVVVVACSAAKNSSLVFDDDGGAASSVTTGSGGAGGATVNASATTGFDPSTGGSTGTGTNCDAGPDEDKDMDGWSINEGDCNDCDPNMNPGAVEVVADPNGMGGAPPAVDEDCDGEIDNVPGICDGQIAVDSNDPMDGARAMDLCKTALGAKDWGVIEAKWVSVDGSTLPSSPNFHLGHGTLNAFGPNVNVQKGQQMFALSSGTARQPTDPGYQSPQGFSKGYTSNHPIGFPKESPSCPGVTTGTPNDGTALQLTIRVPTNANGFAFDFNFYTFEWPGYVCSQFNDFFVAILDPIPMGQKDGNISFDSQNNPVSVNNAFLEVCGCQGGPPCAAGGKNFTCSLGNSELAGTGFEAQGMFGQDHGATSWLTTQAPVVAGTVIKMMWGVYDSGDGVLDSTTLIDNWRWIAEPGTAVGTKPIPDPK
ncbi:MAG: choice-of-anchor L domain-containing protein [Polyangiaceae bacterium]